jgi:hypothetical protein
MSSLESTVHEKVAGFALSPREARPRKAPQTRESAARNRSSILRALLAEPFVHFLVAGALIFGAAELIERHRSQYRIVVSAEDRTRIAESYRQQYGSLPGKSQLETLLRNFVKEEILYREALALGLDRGDEIVRRRLAQKITFLQQDLALLDEPSDSELEGFYESHAELYTEKPRRSFTHIYFSPDTGGDRAARARAERELLFVTDGHEARSPERGDAFPGSTDLVDVDRDVVERLFGRSELEDAVFAAPVGQWSGPYRSGFGWHLVRVTSEQPARTLPYDEVRERVRQNYDDSRRGALNQAAFDELASKYQVVEDARR